MITNWQLIFIVLTAVASFITFIMIGIALWNAEWHEALRIFLAGTLPTWVLQAIFVISLVAGLIATAVWIGALFLLF